MAERAGGNLGTPPDEGPFLVCYRDPVGATSMGVNSTRLTEGIEFDIGDVEHLGVSHHYHARQNISDALANVSTDRIDAGLLGGTD